MKTTFEFRDPLEISEELAKLGQLTKITQLDGGNGIYTMQAATANKVSLTEISANKTLLYEGWGNGVTIDFNWITPKIDIHSLKDQKIGSAISLPSCLCIRI